MTGGILTLGSSDHGGPTLVRGPAFTGFVNEVVAEDARESVQRSAVSVLEAALTHGPGSTGLVVGRVQSGKTLSYEAVISLARDNGFAIVVVITGISNPLLAQGTGRLRRDLSRADQDGWTFCSPGDSQQPPGHIERELLRVRENWANESTPLLWKQTAVVAVLKNYGRIGELADTFRRLALGSLRVLIIDDEADQASLNTMVRKGRESSTYANLTSLRDALPHHYYLQYTATPQAPLLIAIQDALSPDYVRVLEPGSGYTGGETYFGSSSNLVETIGAQDLLAVNSPGDAPPDTLRRATQEFLVGAAHVVASGARPETRSMLVHPSRETGEQGTFATWIRRMKDNWQDKYEHRGETEPAKMRAEFEEAWRRLRTTYPSISEFEACWDALGLVFRNLEITEVNARGGQTPIIEWSPTKSYILVGGQAIDRGFTVEGLTVTYMSRGAGTFTADTIQQRARFFGYKAAYLGLCRVYLEPDVRSAFEMYVEHEREMLSSLREIEAEHDSLKAWHRRFLLDRRMRPTRASVIDIPTIHVSTADRWITDRYPVRDDALDFDKVRERVAELLASVSWQGDATGLHQVGWTDTPTALELLELTSPESLLREPTFEALSVQMATRADDSASSTNVAIFRMRPGHGVSRRTEERDGGIQLFAGRNQSGKGYRGDRSVFEPGADLTVQVHEVEVFNRETDASQGKYVVTAWRVVEPSPTGWIVEVV